MIILIILYIVCALTFTISKYSLLSLDPFFYLAIRMFFAGCLFFLLSKFENCKKNIDKKSLQNDSDKSFSVKSMYFIIIFFSFFLSAMFDILSLSALPSWGSALIYSLSPIVTGLIAKNVNFSWNHYLGMVLACSGSILYQLSSHVFVGECWSYVSLILCFFAMFFGAKLWVDIENHKSEIGNEFNKLFFCLNFIASMIFFVIWLLWGSSVSLYSVGSQIVYVVLIVLISNVIFSKLYTQSLLRYSSTAVSLAGCLCPFYVLLLGIFFLKETCMNINIFILSILVCFVGLLLFFKKKQ